MNKPTILEEAAQITGGSRQENYGHPLPNHQRIAILWNAYLEARAVPADRRGGAPTLPREAHLRCADVVMFMILLKIARELPERLVAEFRSWRSWRSWRT